MSGKTKILEKSKRIEFGDWQTPLCLATEVCKIVSKFIMPKSIFEPNCGKGAFLKSAIQIFPESEYFLGLEINSFYADKATEIKSSRLKIINDDFFTCGWENWLKDLKQPLLIIGNPPWATNSELARLRSKNLPEKNNINSFNGIDAITGKSNFDISEWMLIREVEALQGKNAVLAMLCKTAVARKVILKSWKNELKFSDATIRKFDAKKHFSVSADACLLLVRFLPETDKKDCPCTVFASMFDTKPLHVLGLRNNRLVSNTQVVDNYRDCFSDNPTRFIWRSGIKHDCSKIMELKQSSDQKLWNGFGEEVNIEKDLLYPMLKSSDLAKDSIGKIKRFMLVTQKSIGYETESIKLYYPMTWQYLIRHIDNFNQRRSSIYRNRPKFSIFGVGEYSFKPWKVAISGLYKKIKFQSIGPLNEKPVIFDDTCYFLPCESAVQTKIIMKILKLPITLEILNAHIFWDSKRPITREVLSVLNIPEIARRYELLNELLEAYPHLFLSKQKTLF
jgi:hypothetical protein